MASVLGLVQTSSFESFLYLSHKSVSGEIGSTHQTEEGAWLPAMNGHVCQRHCCHWAQVVISLAKENLHPFPERVCFRSFDVYTNCKRVAWVIHSNICQSQMVCRIRVEADGEVISPDPCSKSSSCPSLAICRIIR